MGSSTTAANGRGLHGGQRSRQFRISGWRVSDHAGALEVVGLACRKPVRYGKVLYEHMKAHNIKTVGYIGYSDSYGDLCSTTSRRRPSRWHDGGRMKNALRGGHVGRGQVLKLVAANPTRSLSARPAPPRLAADRPARTWLQGPDLSDPRRCQHGLYRIAVPPAEGVDQRRQAR